MHEIAMCRVDTGLFSPRLYRIDHFDIMYTAFTHLVHILRLHGITGFDLALQALEGAAVAVVRTREIRVGA